MSKNLEPGVTLPDFELPDANGGLHRLSELQGDSPLPGLRIEKVYVGYWFWGRPSIYQLWADLQEIHMRIKADYDPTTPEARAAWEAERAAAAA
jgi:hypothetical protein